MNLRHPVRWAALIAAGLTLTGCITVFPKATPAQYYRFDVTPPAAPPSNPAGPQISVIRAPTTFAHGAESDRILTSTGDQLAYIAAARWISPAGGLFDEAESNAFDQAGGRIRLLRRGEIASAPVILRLDVQTFEARYLDGPAGAPTVVVRVRAILTRSSDRTVINAQTFESRKPAADNRVSAIVPGFDAALTDVLGQVVNWTNAQASS